MLLGLVALAALVLYVGWVNRLTKEEGQILGTWYSRTLHGLVRIDFFPDRTCSVNAIDYRTGVALWPTPPGSPQLRWRVWDGKLIETLDPNLGFVDHVRRMLPAGFLGAVAPFERTIGVVERLTADEFIVREKSGNIGRMTRTPPD
jgi:hypothetical protein